MRFSAQQTNPPLPEHLPAFPVSYTHLVEDVSRAALIRAAQRQRDDLCACVLHGSVDQVERILAGTKDKALSLIHI